MPTPTPPSTKPPTPAPPKAPAPPPTPKLPHPLERFIGQRIVIQMRAGTTYEGELRELRHETMYLEGVAIRGSKHVATVAQLLIMNRREVVHVNTVPIELRKRTPED